MADYAMLDDTQADSLAGFDLVIDVRSPSEFAEDRLPGAINLPVLSDDERARVGTVYKQVSTFDARREGAALVTRNIGHHLETALAGLPKKSRLLLYCWRGGMRSRSMALVLSAVGWKITLLRGGYRTWRREVVAQLEHSDEPLPFILIDGQTGTAKTAILLELAARGAQIIDLEGLASHRGSAFGDFAAIPQPSQKRFETLLWEQLRSMDLSRPIYLEAESNMVGRRQLPARIWTAMKAAPRITISAPVPARAAYLVEAYPDLAGDAAKLNASLDQLASRHAKTLIAQWRELHAAGDYRELAAELITAHYDAAYNRAREHHGADPVATLRSETLDPEAIGQLADAVLAAGVRP
ncbi:tRNA 2-selenouridine(34) synthase MnmH [uncultured Maricaulis sp.]|uniref:tRNA 2-selenouridine(34) synthase MnmH n=1 Tax=uncultured Maricaulis sp. TaxID=174710 RepID=UPI0030DB4F47|tara:strand:- start:7547 stop:8608 length:1062 start_codon:yes stop_codon:yes gene_type:complete